MDPRGTLVALFEEMAELMVLEEGSPQAFRVRAYENAAPALRAFSGDLATTSAKDLVKTPGIGKGIADKIREFLETGSIQKLEDLRKKHPTSVVELSRLPGLGPKGVAKLRKELGIESIAALETALGEERLRGLPGFGEKTESKLKAAIERLGVGAGKEHRTPVGSVLPLAERIAEAMRAVDGVLKVEACGSLRRMRETIGDIDILVASESEPAPIMNAFKTMPMVSEILVQGHRKTSIITQEGPQVDLRVVTPDQFGAALLYFTGSKSHNIKLRQRALDRGLTLNEYGLSEVSGGRVVASQTETEIYEALDLTFVPPPMREDTGEVERAADGTLPEALTVNDLLGDCHVHTALSGDAKSAVEDIVREAAGRSYEYLAITDHAENLPRIGIGRKALLEQRDDLKRLQDGCPDMQLLQGIELNIDERGGLDYDLDFRLGLEFCVAAIHSHFDLSQQQQTERILRAMEDPSVKVIGHLSARRIGRRPGIDMDIDAVLEGAEKTGTAIEINSALGRLDASSEVLRRAFDRNVLFVVSSDAHHTRELDNQRFGALHAQRGWVRKDQVVNTWSRKRFLEWARAGR